MSRLSLQNSTSNCSSIGRVFDYLQILCIQAALHAIHWYVLIRIMKGLKNIKLNKRVAIFKPNRRRILIYSHEFQVNLSEYNLN